MQFKKIANLTAACAALLLCTAFWQQAPQSLPTGDYTLTLSGGMSLNKTVALSAHGHELTLKAEGISITGHLAGRDWTGYSAASLGGVFLRGVIQGEGMKGDGVVQYKSKSPLFVEFSLTPLTNLEAPAPVVHHTGNHNKMNGGGNGGFPDADPTKTIGGGGGDDNLLRDSRDGNEYRTVRIGNRTWTAENMRFNTNDGGAYFNSRSPKPSYGRHYTWTSAQKVCPPGWRLPSDEDWKELIEHLGENSAAQLKSKEGWNASGNGSNASGFDALPAGFFSSTTKAFDMQGDQASFWTSTEYFGPDAYAYAFNHSDKTPRRLSQPKTMAHSCRCVK